eukprot:CAMPEP_0119481808 /NCGR_PEP_ID=MMETSP1344-20130328/9968_1 /TAXON_ID=236787 /ORGANISM="Florenciella parvula, Strain CCMP2471" /LENGTH=39 /DNA_ID= /DNA_START= /DNA_END= /DNA_ORIENTATION=
MAGAGDELTLTVSSSQCADMMRMEVGLAIEWAGISAMPL